MRISKQVEEFPRAKNQKALAANAVIKNLEDQIRSILTEPATSRRPAAHRTRRARRSAANGASGGYRSQDGGDQGCRVCRDRIAHAEGHAAKADASILWARLGQGELGLKKYDEAAASFKKALDVEAASKKPNL